MLHLWHSGACGLVYAGFYRYAQDLLGIVQVRAAFRALRGDIHARTALDQVAHGGFQTGGYAACTEGFEYDLGVAEQHGEE